MSPRRGDAVGRDGDGRIPRTNGIDAGGQHVAVKPSWEGHVSIDAYSGPMHAWPLAYDLLRDPALKARMALHYGCFLKRLRPFRIYHLSKNADLQAAVSKYLQSGVVTFDADDPDLTKADEVWGFYLPQYNALSAASYPTACPATLQREPLEQDSIDVTAPGYTSKLVLLRGGPHAGRRGAPAVPGARSLGAVLAGALPGISARFAPGPRLGAAVARVRA